MESTKRPCDLHAWQPVALPDGRTVILCGKCGQHAVTLPAETVAPFLPPIPAPQPYPIPTNPYAPYAPIWVDPQFFRPIPVYPYTITYQTLTAGSSSTPPGEMIVQ